jgi:hypothetical protein
LVVVVAEQEEDEEEVHTSLFSEEEHCHNAAIVCEGLLFCSAVVQLRMPYISLLVGQCGNQLGSATLEEVASNCDVDLTRLFLARHRELFM